MAELHDLSIADASGLIMVRKLSSVELVEALIQRVEQYDAQTRAFITRTFDLARRQARAAEAEIAAGKYRGALHGIPFALKDIYDTKGFLTSGHSRVFIDRIPGEDATTTSKLYDAGAVLLGKLATHEMAHAGPSFDLPWPPARNPWSLAHFTGGSSSGSGAAVAAGMVPLALGSDTGGSIRGPASLCGVVGLMPTFGLVSRAGVITNSYTFDHCGPLARTVEDCALVLQALAGDDPNDAGSGRRGIPAYRQALRDDLRRLRIGVLAHPCAQRLVLAEAERVDRVERDGPARAGAAQRLRQERAAARHADRRPALRRDDDLEGRPRLRTRHGVAHAAPPARARRGRAGRRPSAGAVERRRSGRRRDARPVCEERAAGGSPARRSDAGAAAGGSAVRARHGGAPAPLPARVTVQSSSSRQPRSWTALMMRSRWFHQIQGPSP